jgi:IS30 family transposase
MRGGAAILTKTSTTTKRSEVMTYRQLAPGERYMLAALRRQGLNQSAIASALGRHRSTVCRELLRNSTRADGRYRASTAPGARQREEVALAP